MSRLGRLDRSIEIHRPVLTANNTGERTKAYVKFAHAWARVDELYGNENDRSDVDYPVLRVTFTIRNVGGILPQYRVLHEGKVYEIIEVKEVTYSRNRFIQLITEKRGNQAGDSSSLPSCEPANYANSDDSFTQEIASGGSYTAPDITVTDVDGDTRDVPANTDVTCEWTTLTVENSEGAEKQSVSSYPTGGNIVLGDLTVTGQGDYPVPSTITISGRPIESVIYTNITDLDLLSITVESCPTIFPISIVNSLGGTLDTISTDPSGSFEIGTVLLNGVARVRPASSIELKDTAGNTPSITVNESDDALLITVPEAVDTSAILYNRPQWEGQETSYATGDAGWQQANGTYDYDQGVGTMQQLDYSAANPFFTLVNDNEFGTKDRFTDSEGAGPNFSGRIFPDDDAEWASERPDAIPYYVIDHLTGLGWHTGGVASTVNWATAVSNANSFSNSTYSDFRLPTVNEYLSALYRPERWDLPNNNILFDGNDGGTGLIRLWTSETAEATSTANAYAITNSNDVSRSAKTSTSFIGYFLCRTHY